MAKKDIRHYKRDFEASIKRLESLDIDTINKQHIKDYTNARIRVAGLRRNTGEIQQLERLADYFKKDLTQLTEQDITRYVTDYQMGKIKKRVPIPLYEKGENIKTKRIGTSFREIDEPIGNNYYEFNKSLKKLIRWKFNLDEFELPKFIRDLPTATPEKKLPKIVSIPDEKIRQFIQLVESFDLKVICGALYNTGLRPQELFQLQFKELDIKKRENGLQKVEFNLDYSKTVKRTVSIWMKEDVELFLTYLREKHPKYQSKGDIPEDFIYPQKVEWMSKLLARLTTKYLGHPYRLKDFRSSHATNFADKVPEALMNTNMGWKQGSQTKSRYIDSNTFKNEDYLMHIEDSIDKKERKTLKIENSKLTEELNSLKSQMIAMQEQQAQIIAQMFDLKTLQAEKDRRSMAKNGN